MSDRDVWVEVAVRAYGADAHYCGTISESTLAEITGNVRDDGFFQLDNICWTDSDGRIRTLEEQTRGGRRRGYTKTAWFQIDHVDRIVPLDDTYQLKSLIDSRPAR